MSQRRVVSWDVGHNILQGGSGNPVKWRPGAAELQWQPLWKLQDLPMSSLWMQLHVARWWRNSHVCISVRKGLQMVYGCVAWVCIAGINSKGSWDNIRRRNPDIWDAPSTSTASLYTPDFHDTQWFLLNFCRTWLDPTGEAVARGWRPQRWWRLWLIRVINAIN